MFFEAYINSSTNRRQTPESITACILSFGPSDRYDKAQHESARTSVSEWNNNLANTGNAGETYKSVTRCLRLFLVRPKNTTKWEQDIRVSNIKYHATLFPN